MRSIQATMSFPLSSVKPLERLLGYRAFCLDAYTRAMADSKTPVSRSVSPVGNTPLVACGKVDGVSYVRCPESGSLFVADLPDSPRWAALLHEVADYRHSPRAFHSEITAERNENVYRPKLEWIEKTIRMQDMRRPNLLEVTTLPSEFTPLLKKSALLREVVVEDEMKLAASMGAAADTAILLESLDRVDDPQALLASVHGRLRKDGLLFITGLVSSGFDMSVLGLKNLYLYPPDRTNCFTLQGLQKLLERAGFSLLEVSTPGVLDVEIVQAHLQHDPSIHVSAFENQLLQSADETRLAFQTFLQQQGLSSFARIVGRKL